VHTLGVTYEWDENKAQVNLDKHKIDFADAATSFEDEFAIHVPDDEPSEDRFLAIAMDSLGRVLVTAYTWRGDSCRIISSRKPTPREQRMYEGRRQ
jgi:uncharacterized DUF497 family protein